MCAGGGISKGKIAAAVLVAVVGAGAAIGVNYKKAEAKVAVQPKSTNVQKVEVQGNLDKVVVLDNSTYAYINSIGKSVDVVGVTNDVTNASGKEAVGKDNSLDLNKIEESGAKAVVGDTKDLTKSEVSALNQKGIKIIDVNSNNDNILKTALA